MITVFKTQSGRSLCHAASPPAAPPRPMVPLSPTELAWGLQPDAAQGRGRSPCNQDLRRISPHVTHPLPPGHRRPQSAAVTACSGLPVFAHILNKAQPLQCVFLSGFSEEEKEKQNSTP